MPATISPITRGLTDALEEEPDRPRGGDDDRDCEECACNELAGGKTSAVDPACRLRGGGRDDEIGRSAAGDNEAASQPDGAAGGRRRHRHIRMKWTAVERARRRACPAERALASAIVDPTARHSTAQLALRGLRAGRAGSVQIHELSGLGRGDVIAKTRGARCRDRAEGRELRRRLEVTTEEQRD